MRFDQVFRLASIATLAISHPTIRDTTDEKYHGVGLALITSPWGEPTASSPAPVEINTLTSLHNFSCYRVIFQPNVHFNVDVTKVECRVYQDEAGQIPGSAPFNYNRSADLATNPVQVGSVLCYLVTGEEAKAF